jgi:PIN domain nuclease of toxin-antitoxin system
MRLLLDTCAVIWIASDAPLADAAVEAIDAAADAGEAVMMSPITGWEIGLLASRGRLALPTEPGMWLDQVLGASSMALAELTPHILLASSFLPGRPPRDPADRIFIATARQHNFTLVTRDRRILEYGKAGHVRVLAC